MSKFCISEADLSSKHGVASWMLRQLRRENKTIQMGTDWSLVKGKVRFSEAGAAKIAAYIGAAEAAKPAPEPPMETMTVIRSSFANVRVIQCRRDNGELVIVGVGSAKNYKPLLTTGKPMTVKAICMAGRWSRAGRDPRYPGRW